ncbi:hypothetical protein C9374_001927 [Naegleria lovaniensis]|uniref:Protein kinase domain-containing protein n=1 Tax=Naegleria lovaniensis TaxID=51637 RepID=A0AA88KQZ2_NAELO|nr:uncharacterized protein C9374_001927 [Naegleria lovaniensis]KAG2386892.1 hypothetical protein C9374_001927 [Naegleria lovaniensis]
MTWFTTLQTSLLLVTLVSYTLAFDILPHHHHHRASHETLDALAPSPYYSTTQYTIQPNNYVATAVTISYGHFDVLAVGAVGSTFEVQACSTTVNLQNAWGTFCFLLATSFTANAYRQQFYNEKSTPLYIVLRNTDSSQTATVKELFVNRVSAPRFIGNTFSLSIPLNSDYYFHAKDLIQPYYKYWRVTVAASQSDSSLPFTLQIDAGFNQNRTVDQTQQFTIKNLSESYPFIYAPRNIVYPTSPYTRIRCTQATSDTCHVAVSLYQPFDEQPPTNQTTPTSPDSLGAIIGGAAGGVLVVVAVAVIVIGVVLYCVCSVIPKRKNQKKLEANKSKQGQLHEDHHTNLHLLAEHEIHELDQHVIDMHHTEDMLHHDASNQVNSNRPNTNNSLAEVSKKDDKKREQTPNNPSESDFPHDSVFDSFETFRIRTTQQPLLTNSHDPNSHSNNINSTSSTNSQNDEQDDMLKGRYKCIREIGSGSFGRCYLCEDTKRNNMQVAIKLIPVEESNLEAIFQECSKTLGVNHKNLVKVFEFFYAKHLRALGIVMKFYKLGDLEGCLKKGVITNTMLVSLIQQLGEALDYLHNTQCILHRDIKPKNIFVEEFDPERDQIDVTLGDYGESKGRFAIMIIILTSTIIIQRFVRKRTNNSFKGTLLYMAPEVLTHEHYGTAADVFSLGVTLYQIVCGSNKIPSVVGTRMLKNEIEMDQEISQNLKEKGVDENTIQFILSMLNVDPDKRPKAQDIKNFRRNV